MLKPYKIKIALTLALLIIAALGSITDKFVVVRATQQDLPDGKGVEIVRDKCVSCHEADLIVSQRLSRQGWVREVDKMVRWGAVVTDAEKDPLLDYLAARFGPAKKESASANPDRGIEIFENRCLVCHEADLTRQQKLSRQGWTREVEKMVRWGAVVTDTEKEPLIEFLFKNYGPR